MYVIAERLIQAWDSNEFLGVVGTSYKDFQIILTGLIQNDREVLPDLPPASA